MPKILKIRTKKDIRNARKHFEKALRVISLAEAEAAARQVQREVRTSIRKGRSEWVELSSKYLSHKERKKLDLRIYISTKEFYKAIVVIKGKNGYYVGMKNGDHTKAKIPYGFLAAILEFGSDKRNIPARPLWRPIVRKKRKKHKVTKILKFFR